MKLAMLGYTRAGKTTYMASLYAIMQKKIEGFSLYASNDTEHQRLMDLARIVGKGEYPALTDQRQQYKFKLQYYGKTIEEFTWADYRGGSILGNSQSEQSNLLHKDLQEVDGIIIFCDAHALVFNHSKDVHLEYIWSLVIRSVSESKRPRAIAIVLSKADLVPQFPLSLVSSFSEMLKSLELSQWVKCSIIPVSCGAQNINVPLPVLFTLNTTVLQNTLKLQFAAAEARAKVNHWIQEDQRRGFWGRFSDWLSGVPTDLEMVKNTERSANAKYTAYAEARTSAEALGSFVANLCLIQRGKKIEDYHQELNKSKDGIHVTSSQSLEWR